ncbi:MAG TPA: sigma-70 family RNA polymerase sigma factor [Phycisphaerae bacterium]|nr:sigma-70 family RNA polymerase sigma factor [Phycisphaerae bacterium]
MGLTEPNDSDLVRMTLTGDHEAYRELVGRYQGHVYGLAYSLVSDWAEAQDIAQETFIRAYSNLDKLRDPAKFPAWLRRVTFGVAMDWLKTFRPKLFEQLDGRVDLDHLEIPHFQPGPPEIAAKRELADAVLTAVASLPPKYRVPLTMFHLDGLSYKKVAEFLDIPLGTAKSMIHRAKEKLKAALPAAIAKEMTPMVQEVFNEHKLREEFAERVLENVPVLAWGKGKECTFAGALEAATAVTDYPQKYSDIMGWTGLAFRVRWFCGNERSRWCASCAVGEMEEEIVAAAKATGWPLRVEVHQNEPDMSRFAPEFIGSIDAGKPIPAYGKTLDMGVIYGYRAGGKTLLFRDYHKADQASELSPSELGWLWLFLDEYSEPLKSQDALVESLRIASHNWRRVKGRQGPGEYWYGGTAYKVWIEDLVSVDTLSEKAKKMLLHVNWWNFLALCDARNSACKFLKENEKLLDNIQAVAAIQAAVKLYEQQGQMLTRVFAKKAAFLAPSSEDAIADWSVDVRKQEQEILAEARELDEAAITQIETALAAMDSDTKES